METVCTIVWDKQNETCIRVTIANTVSVELILDTGNSMYSCVGQAKWDLHQGDYIADTVISVELTLDNGSHMYGFVGHAKWNVY